MENKNMLDKVTPPPLPNSGMVNNHSAEANYGIMDWFKKGLRNYANFSGRARRKEYWYFVLVQMGLVIIAMILDAIIFNSEIGLFYIVVALGLFLPGLAVTIRRLHDTSRSGWWFLISILPLIGSIILLVFLASDTKLETNQWGPPAK
ncbi:DUF805 domain-containing protein [Psychrobacter faecalis]|jgi:uncharacterized membrane protein YhaH (DUF805 family)|uniref:DUF805 domain-containing protein n=1 Tax=Psychrobacter faecalis TaxID=180588 RepID=A0ABT9HIM6_9GAMM|nr:MULTISPECIES: DUF805 domain-containing protein [Psychrobacter]MDP4545578.1 DUF805 domain-containing protein [Psychrobacter faecalis]OAP70287.1 hypothetical protein A7325_07195 [Psychrobacter sp. SHUES1]